MEVSIYIGFWTLKMKYIQYGLYGKVAFKNARANLFLELDGASNSLWSGTVFLFLFYFIKFIFCGGCVEMMDCGSWPLTTSSLKFVGGGLASAQGDLD